MAPRKKILFIVPYPLGNAPSQRFRFEQYFSLLQSNQIEIDVQPFLTESNWRVFYAKTRVLNKTIALLLGFLRRIIGLSAVLPVDFVFIHREASPIGPPIFEWIIGNLLRKKIIYDFDDAIWLTDKPRESLLARTIKWRGKVSTICKLSYRISCGNQYLCAYASSFSQSVVLNPTTIDTKAMHFPKAQLTKQTDGEVVIGWTGSHSTLRYLYEIEPTLQHIERTYRQVRFLVIADIQPTLNLERLTFVPWSAKTEVVDLMNLDIGIMPLPGDEWSKGKCGFKILQYMSLSIPSVSSPIGVNTQIVKHGENGFLASNKDEWALYLSLLIESPVLRNKLGSAGRITVANNYSVTSNSMTFLSLFE